MPTDTAQKIVRDAETALRRAIEQALRDQRYADVAEAARLADGVARLLVNGAGTATNGAVSSRGSRASKARAGARPSASADKRRDYPKYVREGDRLVKIGWSKKHRAEYEHRAPREAVVAVIRHLCEQARPGGVFRVEDLMPIVDRAGGDEVPTYQVYLVLAWLREVGAVEKKGRDGYVLRRDGFSNGALDNLWAGLPARSA